MRVAADHFQYATLQSLQALGEWISEICDCHNFHSSLLGHDWETTSMKSFIIYYDTFLVNYNKPFLGH